jgi:hypothetical protein
VRTLAQFFIETGIGLLHDRLRTRSVRPSAAQTIISDASAGLRPSADWRGFLNDEQQRGDQVPVAMAASGQGGCMLARQSIPVGPSAVTTMGRARE